jgi:predicted nucleic acid-binding protein
MEIRTVLIDTNAYAEFKKGNPLAVAVIRNVNNIVFTPIVIAELISGFILGTKEKQNRKDLKEFLDSKRVITIDIDQNTSENFAQIFKELRKKGKPIPTNDIWICAIARQYELPVFSYDAHFKYIDGITVVKTVTNSK